jgi:uncharacterized coiled-coil protein SlyX
MKSDVMDKLERAIAEKRRELEQLQEIVARQQRQAELLAAELRAMESASHLRPLAANGTADETRRGRQPGAISAKWKEVLLKIFLLEGVTTYEAIVDLARGSGIAAELASVRERVRRFQELGFVDGSPATGFRVTAAAIERFDLSPEIGLDLGPPPSAYSN